MATYDYIALDAQGKQTTGTVQANSEAEAIQDLRNQSLFPTQVVEQGKAALVTGEDKDNPKAKGKSSTKKGKQEKQVKLKSKGRVSIKASQRMLFTRQLATLIGAGLPILRSLTVLAKQEPNEKVKHMLNSIADSIQGGATFSQGLTQFPAIFDKLYINMVRAGEVGGVLEVVLDRLAEYMEKAEKLKKKAMSAMVYPIIVLLLAVGIMTFLMTVIVPQFKEMFDENGVELPAFSKLVFNFSSFMGEDNLFIFNPDTFSIFVPNLVLIVIIAVVSFISYRAYRRTENGREVTDRLFLKVPLFGNLIEKSSVARFTRTLGTLVSSGVPILQALNITKETSGNVVYGNAIQVVHDAVKEGEPLVAPMQSTGVFPALVVSMVDVGEETGQLPDMLTKIADIYEDEVENAVNALTSILEPLLIVGLAVLVGCIVLAIFLPLLKMIESV